MRTTTNPGVVKYQAQCSCGDRGKKHATVTIAKLSMVLHLAEAEVMGGIAGHNIGVMAVLS
jgi:hypothetical protein